MGVQDRVEIWDKGLWEERSMVSEEDLDDCRTNGSNWNQDIMSSSESGACLHGYDERRS